MKTQDIFKLVESKELALALSWNKNYGNGTILWEYKIVQPRHKKQLAYMQIGAFDNGDVMGVTITHIDNGQRGDCVDCETLTDISAELSKIRRMIIIRKNIGKKL
jgi:hypothetical protein